MASDEHYRVLEEQRLVHAREDDALVNRLATESADRERQWVENELRLRDETAIAERNQLLKSQLDISNSKFVAQYADQEIVADAKRLDEQRRTQEQRLQEIEKKQELGTLQPPSREDIIKAEDQRLQSDLQHAQRAHELRVEREMERTNQQAQKEGMSVEEQEGLQNAKEEALQKAAAEREAAIRKEAQERLDRMLSPYRDPNDRER